MKKYAEIMNWIEALIETGAVRGGHKLPSIRELSQSYSCSKSTVIRAYAELEKRHLVYTVPQSGYYAVIQRAEPEQTEERPEIDLSSPSPDPELFPYLDFQHCLNKAIDMYRNLLFVYGTPQGLPSLLRVMEAHLADYQVFARPGQITVTSGVQQALAILATMSFPSGRRTVLIEQPTYPMMIRLLYAYGIPVQGIARTENGIDLNELERIFRTGSIKLFYTIPRFHNPLGTSYDEYTKKAIAELAKRYDVYIAEDDYLADLETNSKSDPIHAYGSSHVVYLKSFSKIVFPGLRVGAAVLPEALQEAFNSSKRLSDIDSSMLSQAALEIYIQSGMFDRRKQKIVDSYNNRLHRLNQALDALNDTNDVRHASVYTGVQTHLTLPKTFPIDVLLQRLRQKRIVLQGIDTCFLDTFEKLPIVKLSITRVEEERIWEAVQILFNEIKKLKPT